MTSVERAPKRSRFQSMAAAVIAAGLAACTAEMPSPLGTDRFLVEPVRISHQVTFRPADDRLGLVERDGLAAFLDQADPDGRADIHLDAAGPFADRRIGAVAAVLGDLGRTNAGIGGIEGSKDGVTVTLLQDVVLPLSCLHGDQWPDPRLPPAGCTQALTLVHMVEDQDDLLRSRTLGPALSETAANAAARYLERRAVPPGDGDVGSGDVAPSLPPPLTREARY